MSAIEPGWLTLTANGYSPPPSRMALHNARRQNAASPVTVAPLSGKPLKRQRRRRLVALGRHPQLPNRSPRTGRKGRHQVNALAAVMTRRRTAAQTLAVHRNSPGAPLPPAHKPNARSAASTSRALKKITICRVTRSPRKLRCRQCLVRQATTPTKYRAKVVRPRQHRRQHRNQYRAQRIATPPRTATVRYRPQNIPQARVRTLRNRHLGPPQNTTHTQPLVKQTEYRVNTPNRYIESPQGGLSGGGFLCGAGGGEVADGAHDAGYAAGAVGGGVRLAVGGDGGCVGFGHGGIKAVWGGGRQRTMVLPCGGLRGGAICRLWLPACRRPVMGLLGCYGGVLCSRFHGMSSWIRVGL